MANISKVTVNDWSAGMQTSKRSLDGANIIKGFDIYDDPTKLKPLTAWERFNTDAEKEIGIMALGGTNQSTETVLGLGKATTNWISTDWQYRVALTPDTKANYSHQLDDSNVTIPFGQDDVSGRYNKIAQKFTATHATVNGAKFLLKSRAGVGSFLFGVYSDSAGSPNTLIGTQFTIDIIGQLDGDSYVIGADFLTHFEATGLTVGQTYWLVAEVSADDANAYPAVGGRLSLPEDDGMKAYNSTDGWFDIPYTLYYQAGLEGIMVDNPYYGIIDLSGMPSEFWSNVQSDGSDILITDYNNNILNRKITSIDTAGQTGIITVEGQSMTLGDTYVYYGNPDASVTDSYSGIVSEESFYPFDGSLLDYGAAGNPIDDDDAYVASTVTPTLGQGVNLGNYDTDVGTTSPWSGSYGNIDFLFYIKNYPLSSAVIADHSHSLTFELESDGTVHIGADLAGSNPDWYPTTVVSKEEWHHMRVTYKNGSEGFRWYLDGELVYAITDSFVFDGGTTQLFVGSSTFDGLDANVEFVTFDNGVPSEKSAYTQYRLALDNSNCWSFGSEEDLDNVSLSYDGTALYSKDLDGSEWKNYTISGVPVVDTDHYPMPAFITQSTPRFITTQDNSFREEGVATMWLSNGSDFTGTLLTVFGPTFESMPRYAQALDGNYYYTEGQSTISIMGGASDVFTAASTINHMTPYGQYLAVAADQNNTSFVQLWDFADIVAEDIDFGFGRIRAVGNIYGTLFGVLNNNLDQGELANGERSLDIKVWQGGSFAEPFYSMKSATSFEGYYTYGYQQPILNQVENVDDGFVFYARTADEDATVHEGLWKIGKNEQSKKFGVSIPYPTDSVGNVDFFYRTGQVLLAVTDDNEIWKTSESTYTNTSSWESNLFAGSDRENVDKLRSIEVTFEPLASGQTISVYYKKEGESSWTLLDTEATQNATSMEITRKTSGGNMPGFKEIQFKIESTGGASAITSFGFTYEDTLDNS